MLHEYLLPYEIIFFILSYSIILKIKIDILIQPLQSCQIDFLFIYKKRKSLYLTNSPLQVIGDEFVVAVMFIIHPLLLK